MASYAEIYDIANDNAFLHRMSVAIVFAVDDIRQDATPPANQADRLLWTEKVMQNPTVAAKAMAWAVLSNYRDLTYAAITGASDSALQTVVNDTIDLFADNI